jgi:hypothetical protein
MNRAQKVEPQQLESDSSVVVSDHPITDRLYAELDSSEVYNDSIIYGYWFKPHEASAVNIFFHKNGTFEFKYYIAENDTTIIDVVKKGTFSVGEADINHQSVITLVADDGWDNNVFNGRLLHKRWRFFYSLENKESGLYLVKGSD